MLRLEGCPALISLVPHPLSNTLPSLPTSFVVTRTRPLLHALQPSATLLQHAAPVRRAMRMRTVFNLLGPLLNPTRPSAIVLGVYAPRLLPVFADALVATSPGIHALVVHCCGLVRAGAGMYQSGRGKG